MQNKILILTNSSSGLWNFRKELIGALRDDYKNIVVSTPGAGYLQELESIGCQIIDTKIDRRGINPITDIKLVVRYIKIAIKEKPDKILTYTIKPNIYGGIVSRLLRVSYAVNITGLGTTFQKKGLLKKIVVFLYKIALKKASVVFFENQENLNIFIKEKIINKEQACLLNGAGVNLKYFSYLDYPEDMIPVRFLFIGRVMKEKGIDELFEAMQMLHRDGIQCILDVLGGYEENYKDKIQEYTEQGWLHYHGYQKDVRPYIKDAHCFVLPSWHEGMANTNLECAAMGRPVITSNIHGCKEAVIDNISGFLCEKQNVNSLYTSMKKFSSLSLKEMAEMGKQGRYRMEDIFDKTKVVENTLLNL